jgi:hypothetical protein
VLGVLAGVWLLLHAKQAQLGLQHGFQAAVEVLEEQVLW